jgi:ribosomal protein S18 acetylase RimI-like enzyme
MNIDTHRPQRPDPQCTQLVVEIAGANDSSAVRTLIVEGLTQRWAAYDAARNPDLESFESTYGSSLVLAARLDNTIVGCGVLIGETQSIARIVRMSVARAHQRRGIGRAVLRALLDHAVRLGYEEVTLETTANWDSAIALYCSHGFAATHQCNGDQHFRLVLAERAVGGFAGA